MKFVLNTLVVFCLLLSISVAANVALEDTEERISKPCNIPSDVVYCMDVMRVGTRFSDERAQHFERLEGLFSEHSIEECSWESFEGKKSPEECISTLSRFAESSVVPIQSSAELDVSERFLDKVCYKGCKAVKCLKCKFKLRKKKRRKCRKKCKRKCRKKCNKYF